MNLHATERQKLEQTTQALNSTTNSLTIARSTIRDYTARMERANQELYAERNRSESMVATLETHQAEVHHLKRSRDQFLMQADVAENDYKAKIARLESDLEDQERTTEAAVQERGNMLGQLTDTTTASILKHLILYISMGEHSRMRMLCDEQYDLRQSAERLLDTDKTNMGEQGN